MTAKTTRKSKGEYLVRDIGLADFGRKEIEIAEYEMPGLMKSVPDFFDRIGPQTVYQLVFPLV